MRPKSSLPQPKVSGAVTSGHLAVFSGASGGVLIDGGAPASGGGGGNSTYTSALVSPPGSPNAGDVWFPTNSYYVFRYSGSVWVPWGPLYPMTQPVSGDFAWINQGGATIDTTNSGVYLEAPLNTGVSMRIRKKAVTTWPVTMLCLPGITPGKNQECGLILRESGSGKLITWGMNSSGNLLISQDFASATDNLPGNNVVLVGQDLSGVQFLRVDDDATNRKLQISGDGQHFRTILSEARTTFITADEYGFYVNEATNSVAVAGMTVVSWTP